jgi:hypothetical protein
MLSLHSVSAAAYYILNAFRIYCITHWCILRPICILLHFESTAFRNRCILTHYTAFRAAAYWTRSLGPSAFGKHCIAMHFDAFCTGCILCVSHSLAFERILEHAAFSRPAAFAHCCIAAHPCTFARIMHALCMHQKNARDAHRMHVNARECT